jgi:hypothetical protein
MKIPDGLKMPLIVFSLESALIIGFALIFTFILKIT